MAQQTVTPQGYSDLYFLSDLQSDISSLWEAALKSEGVGWLGQDSKGHALIDTSMEIEDLVSKAKLMCFYNEGIDSRENRKRFLIDYVKQYYTAQSLKENLIPSMSFVKRVVNNTALLYKDGAERSLEDEKANEVYQSMIKDARIGIASKRWHRIYKLCDVVAVQPVVQETRGKRKLKYQVHSPNNFRILQDAEGNLTKFMYSSHIWNADVMTRENIIVVWTDEEHYYRDADGMRKTFSDNPGGANSFGIIPVVLMARDESEPFGGGMHSLVESNLHFLMLKMLESEDILFAATSTPFMVNVNGEKGDPVPFGPRIPISVTARDVDVEPDMKYVSGTPHADMIRKIMDSEERNAALREGMSPAMLSDQPTELSGKALKNMMMELLEARQDDAIIMQEYEAELYQVTRIVAEAEGLASLPEDGFSCDFPEPRFNDDPIGELDYMVRLRDEGLASDLDLFKMFNSDQLTDDDALKAIANNRAQNKRSGASLFSKGTGSIPDETNPQQQALLAGTQS